MGNYVLIYIQGPLLIFIQSLFELSPFKMTILRRQGIILIIVSYLADVCLTTKLLTEKNLIKFKREKRNGVNDELKDQIFKRIEVLECTVTMAAIKTTSNSR